MSIDQIPTGETHNQAMNIVIGMGDVVRRAKEQDMVLPANPHQLDLPYVIVMTPTGNCSKVFIENLIAGEQYTLVPDKWNPLKTRFNYLASEVRITVPLGTDTVLLRTLDQYSGAASVRLAEAITDTSKLRILEAHVDNLTPIGVDEYSNMLNERAAFDAANRGMARDRGFGSRILSFFKK